MYTSIKKFLRACFEFSNIIGSWNSYDRFDPGPAYHWKKGSAIIPIMWKPLYSDRSSHSVDDHWERLQFIFVPYGNHSPAIKMIVVIIWKPPLRGKASYKPPTFCTYQLFYNIISRKPTFCNYSLCTSFFVLWFVLIKDKLLRKLIRFTNKKRNRNKLRFKIWVSTKVVSLKTVFNLIFLLLAFLDSVILEVILRYHFL